MAAGTPCPGLCRVEIVHPDGGPLPGEPGDRRHLVPGLERGRGHGDHRECRDPQERSQQAVGVIVPGRGPGDVENMPELADPFPVCRTQANRFFPGEQVVFGEPIRAFPGAIGIEDAIDIEQQSGARHLSSMDAASCGGSRAGQRRGRCGRGCGGVHKPHRTLPPAVLKPRSKPEWLLPYYCRTKASVTTMRSSMAVGIHGCRGHTALRGWWPSVGQCRKVRRPASPGRAEGRWRGADLPVVGLGFGRSPAAAGGSSFGSQR